MYWLVVDEVCVSLSKGMVGICSSLSCANAVCCDEWQCESWRRRDVLIPYSTILP